MSISLPFLLFSSFFEYGHSKVLVPKVLIHYVCFVDFWHYNMYYVNRSIIVMVKTVYQSVWGVGSR